MPELCVKSYPELNSAALKAKETRFLRLWLVLRLIDNTGQGFLLYERVEKFVLEHKVYTIRNLYKTLEDGDGLWWICYPKGVRYMSLRRLCVFFDIHLSQHPALIPLSDLRKIGDFRAMCQATLYAEKPTTIATSTVASITGASRQTVIRRNKRARVRASENFMVSQRPANDAVIPELAQQGFRRSGDQLVKQLPNTYTVDIETTRRGMARGASRCSSTGRRRTRLYYEKLSAALRAVQRLADGENIFIAIGHSRTARLWQGIARHGDLVVAL